MTAPTHEERDEGRESFKQLVLWSMYVVERPNDERAHHWFYVTLIGAGITVWTAETYPYYRRWLEP